MSKPIKGADQLLRMLKEMAEGAVEIEIGPDTGGKMDDHKNSFLMGEDLVKNIVPKVWEMMPQQACGSCFTKGAMLAAISYTTFLHHGSDDLKPDEDLRKLFHEMLDDAFDHGFESHKKWLEDQAQKETKH